MGYHVEPSRASTSGVDFKINSGSFETIGQRQNLSFHTVLSTLINPPTHTLFAAGGYWGGGLVFRYPHLAVVKRLRYDVSEMRQIHKNFFFWPTVASLLIFVGIWYGMGFSAFVLVVILSVLEVTLSFDNAVVNARILKRMDTVWQKRFLTWGILFAVFGTRFLLPILIVSIAVMASPAYITKLVFTNPEEYSLLLDSVHASITAFGGVFLLMVSLKFFFDKAKSVHWFRAVEKHLVRWGHIEAVEIAVALTLLTTLSFVTNYDQATVLVSGLIGLILFIIMEGVAGSLSVEGKDIAVGGATLFIYLNILDSAFSLDGVIGAFALTNNLIIIMVGLGIGAYFVRAITLYFVRQDTLTELVYLEHGAHWAILGLAGTMLANLIFHVPEVVIGSIGLCFVILSYRSSVTARNKQVPNTN